MTEIVPGSLVVLKGGYMVMVVGALTRVNHASYEVAGANCYWHSDGGKPEQEVYPLVALELIDQRPTEPVDYKAAFFHAWRSRDWSDKDIELKWAEHERAMAQAQGPMREFIL